MDLLTVWFMNRFLTRPMYVFGFGGILAIIGSFITSFYLLTIKLLGEDIGEQTFTYFRFTSCGDWCSTFWVWIAWRASDQDIS